MRLELLKLAYEIEAIKKTNGLTDGGPSVPETIRELAPHAPPAERRIVSQRQIVVQVTKLQAFGYGCCGGLAVVVVELLTVDLFNVFPNATILVIVSYLIRVLLMVLLGGFTAMLSKPKTPADAVVRGIVAPLLLALVISGAALRSQYPTIQPPVLRN